MIELLDLWRIYQVGNQRIEAVRGLSLSVEAGQFVSIVGHSGSGKSTLLSMIGGLARPSRGRVLVDGVDIWAQDDAWRAAFRNANIGFVFQFASLIPTLTALENVVLPRMFSNGARRTAPEDEGTDLLALVGLADRHWAYPSELSGGQQRRVAIARALINRPALILADEPTGDLDEETEVEVMDLLRKTGQRYNSALLVVTHNRGIAETADRMLCMKNGVLA